MRAALTDRNFRRVAVLAAFVAILYAFRHLAVLLVFFVLFERALGTGAAARGGKAHEGHAASYHDGSTGPGRRMTARRILGTVPP